MSVYWNFEIKEHYSGRIISDGKQVYRPKFEVSMFPDNTHILLGVWYPTHKIPDSFIDPDRGYELALNAVYYWCPHPRRKWELQGQENEFLCLGGPRSFLLFISSTTGQAISWPEVYANYRRFYMWDRVQLYPWRELIRRHVQPDHNYISDVDMIISDRSTYGDNLKEWENGKKKEIIEYHEGRQAGAEEWLSERREWIKHGNL